MMHSELDSSPDEAVSAVAGEYPATASWPDPSPLADWWDEVMRHDHPASAT
ncbi:hypothetical protein [Nocardia sp. NBC_00416]|uniref:hypothetical protein n=1 Tax=Nocardia sp. NBC_00416 TaxID=2975991 RepID=UPI002E1ADC7F